MACERYLLAEPRAQHRPPHLLAEPRAQTDTPQRHLLAEMRAQTAASSGRKQAAEAPQFEAESTGSVEPP